MPKEILESVIPEFSGMEHNSQRPHPFKENGKPSLSLFSTYGTQQINELRVLLIRIDGFNLWAK